MQEYTSANTSIKQIAHTFKAVQFKNTDRILDYGGGKYEITSDYMKSRVAVFEVFDPYNRAPEHNARVIARDYNVITCNNVLNVIKENEIIEDIVKTIYEKLPTGGRAYFLIKAPDKKHNGAYISNKGYQRNEKPTAYTAFIESQPWATISRKGNLFTCIK